MPLIKSKIELIAEELDSAIFEKYLTGKAGTIRMLIEALEKAYILGYRQCADDDLESLKVIK